MPLHPHKFIKVGVEHRLVNPLHVLEPPLHPIPVRLCHWVHKVKGVIHSVMTVDRLQLLHSVVRCPLVAVNHGSWSDMASDDGEKSLCRTVKYNAHDPQCRRLRGVAVPKHPDLVGGSSSCVMLGLVAKETLVNLHNYSITTKQQ